MHSYTLPLSRQPFSPPPCHLQLCHPPHLPPSSSATLLASPSSPVPHHDEATQHTSPARDFFPCCAPSLALTLVNVPRRFYDRLRLLLRFVDDAGGASGRDESATASWHERQVHPDGTNPRPSALPSREARLGKGVRIAELLDCRLLSKRWPGRAGGACGTCLSFSGLTPHVGNFSLFGLISSVVLCWVC